VLTFSGSLTSARPSSLMWLPITVRSSARPSSTRLGRQQGAGGSRAQAATAAAAGRPAGLGCVIQIISACCQSMLLPPCNCCGYCPKRSVVHGPHVLQLEAA
jgi:hypothetical protein